MADYSGEVCANCRHWHILPADLSQGVCRERPHVVMAPAMTTRGQTLLPATTYAVTGSSFPACSRHAAAGVEPATEEANPLADVIQIGPVS